MSPFKVIAFDADDTLWVNEPIFTETQEKFKAIVGPYLHPDGKDLEDILYQTELRNLRLFGYGIKGFTLSMIETGIEISRGKMTATEIAQVIEMGKEMLEHPVELLPGVRETIEGLQGRYELMVITKGDLFDQESKLARSGIADLFQRIEVVSEKDEPTYQEVLQRNGGDMSTFLMVGNSLKSDILPICRLGGRAVHIPFHTTWQHEQLEQHRIDGHDYAELPDISLLPGFLEL